MDRVIEGIVVALDIVEGELLGVSTNHGKRVAVLTAAMARHLRQDDDHIRTFSTCALLHDNALTEYIQEEQLAAGAHAAGDMPFFGRHCEIGQRNVECLFPNQDISGLVLYHHERADGQGSFQKVAGETPLGAELTAIADTIDSLHHLQRLPVEKIGGIRDFVQAENGNAFSVRAAHAFLAVFDEPMLRSLRDDTIIETIDSSLPPWIMEFSDELVFNLGELATRIIDYKSAFTRRHSAQIANKAYYMAHWYGYERDMAARIFLAAALHDLGKLTIPSAILEKPGKLTDEEFLIIKSHVYKTWELLKGIQGFEEICAWASNHHEKLDGTGYPFGKKAKDLDFVSRLLCCIDIYQAVSEERPYHAQRSHRDTMNILYDMAAGGVVDKGICRDLDKALIPFDLKDVPPPV
jgi:HD-GYP domain-containing protein (c-di-GMP phosphodiesterase class II)